MRNTEKATAADLVLTLSLGKGSKGIRGLKQASYKKEREFDW